MRQNHGKVLGTKGQVKVLGKASDTEHGLPGPEIDPGLTFRSSKDKKGRGFSAVA